LTLIVSNRLDEKRRPSVEEFGGWYNLGYERDDGLPVLHSIDQVPEFEHAEFFDLYKAENRWFEQLVPESARKPFDPLAEPPFVLRSSADDRTLDVDVNFDYLSVDLIQRIQQDVLSRYPFWRVILSLENPSCAIVIYPDAVRYGNFSLGCDAEKALRELVNRATALRENRLRPQRDQISFLRLQLPSAIRGIGDDPFSVLGVLDNYNGDYSRLTLFLLIRGADDDAVDIEGPEGMDNDFLSTGSAFGVSDEGTIVSHTEFPESAPFCVGLWLPPADFRGRLNIVEQATGKRITYEVKSEHIAS
jgi:hypothetical protein